MKISEARGKPRGLAVSIGDGQLNVTYQPADYTVADLEEIQSRPEDERVRAVVELFVETIKSWDLEYDDGGGVVELDPETLRLHVPVHILTAVLERVQKETAPSPEA